MGRKLKKIGSFFKEHWAEIAIGVALIGGAVVAVKINRSRGDFEIPKIVYDNGFTELGNSGLGFFNEEGVERLSDKFSGVPGKITEAIRFNTNNGPYTGMTFVTPVEDLGKFGEKLMEVTSEKADTIPVTVFGIMNE